MPRTEVSGHARGRLALAAGSLVAWAVVGCSIAPPFGSPAEPAAASTDQPGLAVSADGNASLAAAEGISPESANCLLRAGLLADLTIPDNIQLPPSAPFAKSWRLRNDGSCVWDETYTLTFIGGDRMEAAPSVPLHHAVLPGGTIDLGVDMIAPARPGSYEGFWKLQDGQGRLFGVGGGGHLSFWVKIEVRPEILEDAMPPSLPEADLGQASVPTVWISGEAALPPGIAFDLDRGEAQAANGVDIVWQGGLAPRGSAQISRPLPPKEAAIAPVCEGENLSAAPILAEDLLIGATVCYRTDQGRTGSLTVAETGEALRFDYTTWQSGTP